MGLTSKKINKIDQFGTDQIISLILCFLPSTYTFTQFLKSRLGANFLADFWQL